MEKVDASTVLLSLVHDVRQGLAAGTQELGYMRQNYNVLACDQIQDYGDGI
jgi:hypothetical protein